MKSMFKKLASQTLIYSLFVSNIFSQTVQVSNIAKQSWGAADIEYLFEHNGKLFFTAHEGPTYTQGHGRELYSWDDSIVSLEADINPGFDASQPKYFESYNGKLFFSAWNILDGTELWSWDGLNAIMELDISGSSINNSPKAYGPEYLTEWNGKLYFAGSGFDGAGRELWSYDGTNAVRETDIYLGGGHSSPKQINAFNNKLYFTANDGVHGEELWSFDGTNATLVADIKTGPDKSFISNINGYEERRFVEFNNKLYFFADDGIHGDAVWYVDETSSPIVSMVPGSGVYTTRSLTKYDNTIVWSFYDSIGVGLGIWDGINLSKKYIDIKGITNIVELDGKVYFEGCESPFGSQIWSFDGDTIEKLTNEPSWNATTACNSLTFITSYNGKLYFGGHVSQYKNELWSFKPCPERDLTIDLIHPIDENISGEVTINVIGTPGVFQYSIDNSSYSNNNTFATLAPGNYVAYVKDTNNCIERQSFSINESPCAKLDIIATTTNSHSGGENGAVKLIATDGTPPYLYSLDSTNFISSSSFSNLEAGSYTAYITDSLGCEISKQFVIDLETSINDINNDLEIKLFPNPISDGIMNIKISSPKSTDIDLTLFDINGKQVYQKSEFISKGDNQFKIKLPFISSVIYFLSIYNASNHGIKVQKLIVE